MNKKTKLLLLISAVLVISVVVSGCSDGKNKENQEIGSSNSDLVDENSKEASNGESAKEVEGDKLPDFKLKDLEGKDVSSEIFGDYDMTIVSIWQSTCGPCMDELEALNVIYNEYKDKGVNVIGISIDSVDITGDEEVKKVAEKLNLEFTNVIADEDYVMELVKYVPGTPTAFIVGKDGVFLAESQVGSRGTEKDIEAFKSIIEGIIKE